MPVNDDVSVLRERAVQARKLGKSINEEAAIAGLVRYAEELEAKADASEAVSVLPEAAAIPSGEPSIPYAGAALKPGVPPQPTEGSDE